MIRAEIISASDADGTGTTALPGGTGVFYSDDVGFFYMLQLEPDHAPGRFKVGFTMDLDGRLRKHRCAAPFAQYVNAWPCKRVWERAAIDCVTYGCEQLHTEVFRAKSLPEQCARADAFFVMMPKLAADSGDQQDLEPRQDAG